MAKAAAGARSFQAARFPIFRRVRLRRVPDSRGFGEMPKMSLPNFGLCVMIIYVAVRQGVAMDINERGAESLRGEDLMK